MRRDRKAEESQDCEDLRGDMKMEHRTKNRLGLCVLFVIVAFAVVVSILSKSTAGAASVPDVKAIKSKN